MKQLVMVLVCAMCSHPVFSQGQLGETKQQLLKAYKGCYTEGNYKEMLAFSCGGQKSIFYFNAKDSLCEMLALDIDVKSAADTVQKIMANGFQKGETKYVKPFLVSKKSSNTQKFPSHIYTNGKVRYCFMPISLDGKTAELNSLIVMYNKK